MEAEGILGFVTGKDKWVSSKASSSVANRVNGLFRSMTLGGARKRRVLRRDIIGGERGQVFVQPPTKARAIWPDVIVINGTNYREEAPGSPVYKDRDGKTLDLTEPG